MVEDLCRPICSKPGYSNFIFQLQTDGPFDPRCFAVLRELVAEAQLGTVSRDSFHLTEITLVKLCNPESLIQGKVGAVREHRDPRGFC